MRRIANEVSVDQHENQQMRTCHVVLTQNQESARNELIQRQVLLEETSPLRSISPDTEDEMLEQPSATSHAASSSTTVTPARTRSLTPPSQELSSPMEGGSTTTRFDRFPRVKSQIRKTIASDAAATARKIRSKRALVSAVNSMRSQRVS